MLFTFQQPLFLLKKIGLPVLLLMNMTAFGQKDPPRKTPPHTLGTFIYQSKAYNYEFEVKEQLDNEQTYSLKLSSLDKKAVATADLKIADTADTDASDTTAIPADASTGAPADSSSPADAPYLFSSFDQPTFVGIFLQQMKAKFDKDSTKVLENAGTTIFFTIKARQDFIDDEPVTAYLILKKNTIHSLLRSNGSNYYTGRLSRLIAFHAINKVTIETQDGAIKNISAKLIDTAAANHGMESPRQFLEFKNPYPISISGKFDAEKFANLRLYCFNCNGIKDLTRYIHLSDLLHLEIIPENNKDDYSPSNRTVEVSPDNPIRELKKEKRSRILEVAAFTDFVGMDQEQPNGLIQIEARRKINLNTKPRLLYRFDQKADIAEKYDLTGVTAVRIVNKDDSARNEVRYKLYRKRWTKQATDSLKTADPAKRITTYTPVAPFDTVVFREKRFHSTYVTLFPSVEPVLLFSKLEQTNRLIDSGKAVNGKINPVQLYQYQLASLGVNLDILKVSFPQLKFSWNLLHGGFYWFRSRVATSTDTNSRESVALNSNYWTAGTSVSFNPDTRWGISFGVNYIHPQLLNSHYSLTSKDGLWQSFLDAFLKTSDDGKMFFRFRWTSEVNQHDNNFTQIQLGYSVNLFVKPIGTSN